MAASATTAHIAKSALMTRPELQGRFQSLVDENKKILFKICSSYCRNAEDREDLAQEILLQLWRSFGSYDERFRFSTWMYRVALNSAISFYRRESTRTRRVVSGDEHLLNIIDPSQGQPDEMRLLNRFMEGLDPMNRALLLLYLDGNSHSDIADVLGISVTNVGTKVSRLRHAMKVEFLGNNTTSEDE